MQTRYMYGQQAKKALNTRWEQEIMVIFVLGTFLMLSLYNNCDVMFLALVFYSGMLFNSCHSGFILLSARYPLIDFYYLFACPMACVVHRLVHTYVGLTV